MLAEMQAFFHGRYNMILSSVTDFLNNNKTTIKVVSLVLLVIVLLVLLFTAKKIEEKVTLSKQQRTKKMVTISIFAALSYALYFIKFNLPFIFPGFLEVQFSNVPVLIGGFLFGPLSGSIIVIIRTIIKLPFTETFGSGELADLLIGLGTVLVSSLLYHRQKSRKGAVKSLIFASLTWVTIGVVSNWLIILPLYIELFGFEGVYGMLSIVPGITESNYMINYLLFAILPFNLLLSSMVSFITFLVYKQVSVIYSHNEIE
jgi:riboflavin transporter FmnP